MKKQKSAKNAIFTAHLTLRDIKRTKHGFNSSAKGRRFDSYLGRQLTTPKAFVFKGFRLFLYKKLRKSSFTVWDKFLLQNLIFDTLSKIERLL